MPLIAVPRRVLGLFSLRLQAVFVPQVTNILSFQKLFPLVIFLAETIDPNLVIGSCSHSVPCSGSPMQTCGCLEFLNKTDISPIAFELQGLKITMIDFFCYLSPLNFSELVFNDCDEMRAHGVFLTGEFTFLDGTNKKCTNGWGVCWLLPFSFKTYFKFANFYRHGLPRGLEPFW